VSSDGQLAGDRLVRAVFDRVRAADPSVADLYNEDAEVHVGSDVHRGRDAVRAFYLAGFEHKVQPHVRMTLGEPPVIAALLEVHLGESTLSVIDLFTLEGDGIARMQVFQP
jgi:hypothetical protein